jgi:hypothetical protein
MKLRAIQFAVLAFGATSMATAQGTNDEARLTVGVSVGVIGGGDLWSVRNQPLLGNDGMLDYISVRRRIRGNITMTGQVTYFPKPSLGWTGEITYLGIGTSDLCQVEEWSGYEPNRIACRVIDGQERAASGTGALAGVVYRPLSRATVQPYVKALAGIALVPRSTTSLTAAWGRYPDPEYVYPIYLEDGSRAVKPTGALAVGITTAPNTGYQLRAELKANVVQLQAVTGPTSGATTAPPLTSVWKLMPSFTVGFDVVLEKRRGRRY